MRQLGVDIVMGTTPRVDCTLQMAMNLNGILPQ